MGEEGRQGASCKGDGDWLGRGKFLVGLQVEEQVRETSLLLPEKVAAR